MTNESYKNEWHMMDEIVKLIPENGHVNFEIVKWEEPNSFAPFSGVVESENGLKFLLEKEEYEYAISLLINRFDLFYAINFVKKRIEIYGRRSRPNWMLDFEEE